MSSMNPELVANNADLGAYLLCAAVAVGLLCYLVIVLWDAELKAAIETTEWHLSDDEKTIISGLGNQAIQNEVTSLLAWREAAQATTDRDKGVVVSKTESVGQGPEPGEEGK